MFWFLSHRQIVSGVVVKNPISMITSNRRLIRLALLAAVVVGIVGSTYISSSKPSELSLSKTLRRVSVIIFLVVTALLVVHTLFLVREERSALSKRSLPTYMDQRLIVFPSPQEAVRRRLRGLRTECTSFA